MQIAKIHYNDEIAQLTHSQPFTHYGTGTFITRE